MHRVGIKYVAKVQKLIESGGGGGNQGISLQLALNYTKIVLEFHVKSMYAI